MSDLADRHRRIVDVVEPLEQMGIDATVEERTTDDGDLCLTLDLRIPPALDSIDGGEPAERAEILEAQCEQLREERDRARERVTEVVRRAEALEERIAELEDEDGTGESESERDPDADGADEPAAAEDGLTDGERETLHALRELGASSASGEIANEVEATLQSVRSWLPKLVHAGHVRAEPDPTDGRRKLYSPVECEESADEAGDEPAIGELARGEPTDDEAALDEPTDDEAALDEQTDDEAAQEEPTDDAERIVHIASNGGSPSQVFHARADCPQLRKSADSVEKDRSVVPHHRPCGNCVPEGLEEGLVAIARGSPTTVYHKREDCPKLGSATDVAVQEREAVPNHDPCDDCVRPDGDEGADDDDVADDARDEADGGEDPTDGSEDEADDRQTAARLCARNDLGRDAVVEALDAATAIYHVQRELGLSSDETEALLGALGVFEDLDGGGHVTADRARSVTREHLPPSRRLESGGGGTP